MAGFLKNESGEIWRGFSVAIHAIFFSKNYVKFLEESSIVDFCGNPWRNFTAFHKRNCRMNLWKINLNNP